jgi:Holliday junction resolvase RusA-like endonuclease
MNDLVIRTNLPDKRLMGNGRINVMGKHRLFQEQKGIAKFDALHALRLRFGFGFGFDGPCRVSTVWHLPAGGKEPDGDNAAAGLKAVWDGFTAAGVWPDDKGNKYEPLTFSREVVKGFCSIGCVVIEIQPLEVDER